jgi:hypothetical protein
MIAIGKIEAVGSRIYAGNLVTPGTEAKTDRPELSAGYGYIRNHTLPSPPPHHLLQPADRALAATFPQTRRSGQGAGLHSRLTLTGRRTASEHGGVRSGLPMARALIV